MRSSNDKGSQFSKFHFPCNNKEKLVLNSFFREYNLHSKNFKPGKCSLSPSQLFVTSPHYFQQKESKHYGLGVLGHSGPKKSDKKNP